MARLLVAVVAVAALAGCTKQRKHAPTGAPKSWLVSGNAALWWANEGTDTAGFGEEVLVYHAPVPHLLVGGRATGLLELEIELFGDNGQAPAHLVDIGPVVGAGGYWSRLSASVSAGPLLTHVRHHPYEGGWQNKFTAGLGLDAGLAVRIHGPLALGAHAFQNLNPENSVTGVALRIEASYFP